jgi:hypothetical protein
MRYVRRILFGMAVSIVAITGIYAAGMLIAAYLARRYSIAQGDTYFVVAHWNPWAIVSIALVAFALGFSRTPRTR